MSYFDKKFPEILNNLNEEDILIITADHGCDPGTPSTDHSREYIPFLICGKPVKAGTNFRTCSTFADIAATILDIFDVPSGTVAGTSMRKDILIE